MFFVREYKQNDFRKEILRTGNVEIKKSYVLMLKVNVKKKFKSLFMNYLCKKSTLIFSCIMYFFMHNKKMHNKKMASVIICLSKF